MDVLAAPGPAPKSRVNQADDCYKAVSHIFPNICPLFLGKIGRKHKFNKQLVAQEIAELDGIYPRDVTAATRKRKLEDDAAVKEADIELRNPYEKGKRKALFRTANQLTLV